MKRSVARALISCAILASTVGAASSAAAGSSLKTYANNAYRFSFQYPPTWALHISKPADMSARDRAMGLKMGVAVNSPDSLALNALAVKRSLSTAGQERADATTLIKENDTVIGAISYRTAANPFGGVQTMFAKANVQLDATHVGTQTVFIVNYKGETIYGLTLILTKPAASAADNHDLSVVAASFKLY